MKRATLYFAVDIIAFVLFVALTVTGVLVRYVLPPGSGRHSTLWGMDRHEWGDLHFWMAMALMAALALHLFFHWRFVVSVIRGRPREGSGARVGLALLGIAALAGLAASPFFTSVERSGETGHRLRSTDEAGETGTGFHINGSVTLLQVEQATGVPAQVILAELGLPADVPTDERLGQLRRTYGFEMHDVRDVVAEHLGQ
ncbi:MAG: DUF4405 domain-containing protein [Planctomycetota bacterium]|jgi:hypothetical protein